MNKKQEPHTAEPTSKSKATTSLDGHYPALHVLSWSIGFLEQFLAIISEPLLIACAAIAVIDFVTGGRLLTFPFLMYTWAGSLAIAVTASFIVTWRRAIQALTLNSYGMGMGLALLGSMLGLVDWAAIDVQSLQQTLGVSFADALAQLNLNIVLIPHLRSAVAITMGVVVAVSNHTAVTTAQAPKRRLAFLEKALNTQAPEPVVKQRVSRQSPRLHVVEPNQALEPLERVRQALSVEPSCSDRRLGKLTNVAAATAKKYRLIIEQEGSQAIK